MNRIWALGLLVTLAASAWAAPSKQADTKRVEAIWDFAIERINRQNDSWFDDGDFPRVINLCRAMYAMYPKDYDIATNLGWMLENIERWDEALAVYIKFRTENSNDPDAAFPEANFYFMKKAYQKVPPLLEPTLKMSVRPQPNNYRTLAHAYERMSQFEDSQRVWQSYLAIAPNDDAAKNNLARVKRKLRGEGTGKTTAGAR